MTNQPPNWVAERAECKIDLLFDSLCQVIERDVGEYNKLPASLRHECSFSAERTDEGTNPILRVYHMSKDESLAVASLTQEEYGISIWIIEKGVSLAFPEWLEQARTCPLSFNSRRFKIWELSQEILGPIFFEHQH